MMASDRPTEGCSALRQEYRRLIVEVGRLQSMTERLNQELIVCSENLNHARRIIRRTVESLGNNQFLPADLMAEGEKAR